MLLVVLYIPIVAHKGLRMIPACCCNKKFK